MDAQLYSRFFFASPECCLLRCVSSRSYSTILSPKSASLEEPSQRRTAQSVTEHRGMFGAGGLELEWLACFSRLNELLAINLEGSPFISIGLSALHLEKKWMKICWLLRWGVLRPWAQNQGCTMTMTRKAPVMKLTDNNYILIYTGHTQFSLMSKNFKNQKQWKRSPCSTRFPRNLLKEI